MRLLPVLIPLVAAFIGMIGAILSALGFARPGRMPRPRRMVNYRVHYDDSLGNTHPDIKGVGELVGSQPRNQDKFAYPRRACRNLDREVHELAAARRRGPAH